MIKSIFAEFRRFSGKSLDMLDGVDVFYCVFQLLMQKQAEVFGNDPPNDVSRTLAKEIDAMCDTYTTYEVAVLYELTNWLRENGYQWIYGPEMKDSLSLFLLGITDEMPDWQKPEAHKDYPWEFNPPEFDLIIPGEAFDQLEELLRFHWFTPLRKEYYEVDLVNQNTASFGHITLTKEKVH